MSADGFDFFDQAIMVRRSGGKLQYSAIHETDFIDPAFRRFSRVAFPFAQDGGDILHSVINFSPRNKSTRSQSGSVKFKVAMQLSKPGNADAGYEAVKQ